MPLGLTAFKLGLGRLADSAVGADQVKFPSGLQAALHGGGQRHIGLVDAPAGTGLRVQIR